MKEILIEDLMTRYVLCVQPDAEFKEALDIMLKEHCSCVIVADGGVPVGILTERDLAPILAKVNKDHSFFSQKVSGVMSAPPVTVNGKYSLFDALVIAKAEKVRHLPVVDNKGSLIGILTQSDLVRAHFQIHEYHRETIEKAVVEQTEELLKANEKLKALVMEDPLLGIGNRRAMEVDLRHTHASAARYGFPFSVLFIDVDHFKLYNDHYGHSAGDEALKCITSHIKTGIRESDRVYRYGGEEFLVVLPGTVIDGAETIAGHLVKDLITCNLPHCKSPVNILTMSIGVDSYSPWEKRSWEDVVYTADRRLYEAKSNGRSRVVARD